MALERGVPIRERAQVHLLHVLLGDLAGGPRGADAALVHPQDSIAQPPHVPHVVRDEEDRLPFGDQPAQALERAAAERRVADSEHFVDQHDVGIAEDRDAEPEPRVQPRRVALHRHVDQALDFRELHDVVEAAIDLAARQPEQPGAEIYVLAAGELGMKARAELDERHDASGHLHAAARRPRHARDQLQQRRLAGAVGADDAEAAALGDVDADVAQRENRGAHAAARRAVDVGLAAARAIDDRRDEVDDRSRAARAIALRHAIEADRDRVR